jgi:hypothetical protein
MPSNTIIIPKTNRPKSFHPFPHLPFELRHKIWSLALLSPLTSSSTSPPPLKIVPFSSLPPNPSTLAALSDINTHLVSEHGPDWRSHPFAYRLKAQAVAACELGVARYRDSRVILLPSKERGLGSGMWKYDVGWATRNEVDRVAASCPEAGRVLRGLERKFGGAEGWVDLGAGGGVCCFWDVEDHHNKRLVPSLGREDALRLDGEKKGEEDEDGMGMVRGLEKAVRATVHCEELAVVWSPKMCQYFLLPENELGIDCVQFKKDITGLLSRHPKLHTIYLVDPSLQPSGLRVPGGCQPKFRGDGASFYEIDTSKPGDGWLAPKPEADRVDVFGWACELNMLLYQAQAGSQPERPIRVKVLACVPDLTIRALEKILKSVLDTPLNLDHLHIAAGIVCWFVVIIMVLLLGPRTVEDVEDCADTAIYEDLWA